ncbi:cupin domain-containing protein [Paenimyroides aestuarii]|uniref:Cupin domain-containing protein n=1 Tax=Paenimyroides aestuarii TaxID=2968490 RepID=A0ABY5NUY0_9FLAO|nr:cupin domain-containing protein [Paenimyroides aestuarii]UUV22390.1 cupin domain-containing protein [Paenimyroides aestuarii]
MKRITKFLVAIIAVMGIFACQQTTKEQEMKTDEMTTNAIFPKGQKGPSELFTGNAHNFGFELDSVFTTAAGNVYFMPGARSNWHSHPSGQILIITDGVGYHQIEGQPVETIKKGDVVQCPPNVRHWHGASAKVGLQQIYIVPNTEKGIVDWQEAVTDAQYQPKK